MLLLLWTLAAVGAPSSAAGTSLRPPPPPDAALRPEGAGQAFVHLFEWSWPDVAEECEAWLGPKGFTAVQVSPPAEHIQGRQWWTRYQPVSHNLTSRSGDEAAFASMVQRCNAAGVGVYADVVMNHCAHGSGVGVAGSRYGGRSYPLFGPKDFHHDSEGVDGNCVVKNYSDVQEVQFCDLMEMPDLCTECDHVQETLSSYLRRLADLGVAGIRVDAAKHMEPRALGKILARVGRTLHVMQEVQQGLLGEGVQPADYVGLGRVTDFDYSRRLERAFVDRGHVKRLRKFKEVHSPMSGGSAIVFADNHDTQRSDGGMRARLTHRTPQLYALANVFMLAHPYGFPQLMSSFRFSEFDQGPPGERVHGPNGLLRCGPEGPWLCEHRWPAIANMVAWRRAAANANVSLVEAPDADTLVLCRGAVACLALHRGEGAPRSLELQLPLAPGTYDDVTCSDAAGCPVVHVGEGGLTKLEVPPLTAVAFHTGAKQRSSGDSFLRPRPDAKDHAAMGRTTPGANGLRQSGERLGM